MTRPYLLPLFLALSVGTCISNHAFAFQSGGARSAPMKGAASCRYESAAGIPSWVTTGAAQNGRFVVVDIPNRKLVDISRTAVAEESESALADSVAGSVVRIRQAANGAASYPFVVELTGGRLLEVDRSLTPRRKVEMATAGLQSNGTQLANLLDWVVVGNGEVFGYADLSAGDAGKRANWRNGFVRFNPQRPESFRVFRESLFPGDERTWMMLTYPLMTSLGSTVYVVRIDHNQMGLWRLGPNDSDLQPMNALPQHLRANRLAPMLPSFGNIEEYPRTMKAVERANMIAGLFAWDNALFVLSRAVEEGQRRWYLTKVDPIEDEVLWTVRVPGSAHHMMVIPGDQEWAFFEKGPVTAPMIQTTHHIRFVNSAQMRSSSLLSLCN